jgi:hypothetical protein
LLEVVDQVGDVLNPHRQAKGAGKDPDRAAFGGRQLTV